MAYFSLDGDTLSPPGRAARQLDDHEESRLVCDGSGHSVLEQRPLMPAVHAWLENHHVNDWGRDGETLLWYVAARFGEMYDEYLESRETEAVAAEDLVEIARDLLARGADPNAAKGHILMAACEGDCPELMVPLLCEAGADPNLWKAPWGETPLSMILRDKLWHACGHAPTYAKIHEIARALLRSGAKLDACLTRPQDGKDESAEDLLQGHEETMREDFPELGPGSATVRQFVAIKGLVHGVRAAKGSYQRYVKKELLVLRALVRKRRATTDDDDQRTAFDILARSPDEIAWRILGFRRW